MNQHAVKFRPYAKLRGRMSEYGHSSKSLAAAIGISESCFGNKLTCRSPWTLPETYVGNQRSDNAAKICRCQGTGSLGL